MIRIGILGTGTMGRVHASAYQRIKGVEVAAMVGRDEGRTKEVASQFRATPLTDPRPLWEDQSIHAVDICYPSYLHKEYALTAFKAGKHVFCEVPLALTPSDASEMIRAAQDSGKFLAAALLLPFVAERRYIFDLIKSKRYGNPISVLIQKFHPPYWEGKSLKGIHYADPVVELLSFEFAYLVWLFGIPKSLTAFGIRGGTGLREHTFASLRYAPFFALVEGSTRVPKDFPLTTSVKIVFEKGTVDTTTRFIEAGRPEIQTFFTQRMGRQGR